MYYAAAAHRSALSAAVRYAALQRAVLLVSAELAVTCARQRAVEKRWVPRLEASCLPLAGSWTNKSLKRVASVLGRGLEPEIPVSAGGSG